MKTKQTEIKQRLFAKFDCMIDGRFIHTFRIPLKYRGQMLYEDEVVNEIEERMPSLKGKNYTLYPY